MSESLIAGSNFRMLDCDAPFCAGNGNIVVPSRWTDQQIADYRRRHFSNGAGRSLCLSENEAQEPA